MHIRKNICIKRLYLLHKPNFKGNGLLPTPGLPLLDWEILGALGNRTQIVRGLEKGRTSGAYNTIELTLQNSHFLQENGS